MPPPSAAAVAKTLASQPVRFEPNAGQVRGDAAFVVRHGDFGLVLAPTGATWALSGAEPTNLATVNMSLLGANPAATLAPERVLPGRVNYLVGTDASRWHTGLPTYSRVVSRGVYPGIDLAWHGKGARLEYDFIVAPEADPRHIAMGYTGAQRTEIDPGGDLVLHTTAGTLRHRRPVAYQTVAGHRRPVEAAFELRGDRVAFSVGRYDRSRPLVIDPVLAWGTYLGGSNSEFGIAIDLDAAGNVYIAGQTASLDFPTTPDALDSTCGCSSNDVFVAKLSPAGVLLYATYIGGTGQDTIYDGVAGDRLDVGDSGELVLAGATGSTDFPSTNSVRPCLGFTAPVTSSADAFLLKLNAAGSALVFSTCLGGGQIDVSRGTALDTAGNAYVVGWTQSADFPTANSVGMGQNGVCLAHTGSTTGQIQDAFVAKFDPAGAMVYSTCWGGSQVERASAVDVDSSGAAWVVGATDSRDFPEINNSGVQTGRGASPFEAAFILKVSPSVTPEFSTYLGGNDIEGLVDVVAKDTAVYVAGFTASTDYRSKWPAAMTQAYQRKKRNPADDAYDAFAARLRLSTTSPVPVMERLTYLGGTHDEYASGMSVADGAVWISGFTQSASDEAGAVSFPRVGPVQATCAVDHPDPNPYRGEQYEGDLRNAPDAFVARLDKALTTLTFSTCLGGTGYDQAFGVAVDGAKNAYVIGRTLSSNDDPATAEVETPFPTTEGALDRTCGTDGLCNRVKTPPFDTFVARIGPG